MGRSPSRGHSSGTSQGRRAETGEALEAEGRLQD